MPPTRNNNARIELQTIDPIWIQSGVVMLRPPLLQTLSHVQGAVASRLFPGQETRMDAEAYSLWNKLPMKRPIARSI
jgi:hypothetical protein